MKRYVVSVLAMGLMSSGTSAALAQDPTHGMKDMDVKPNASSSERQVHQGTGTVKKIDQQNAKVTLAHQPIATLDWPAMTMTFEVHDKKLLTKMTVGKSIRFELMKYGNEYVITSVH